LEGVNFAMASGMYAGQAAIDALKDTPAGAVASANSLAGYQSRLEDTFVLSDHRRLKDIPSLVLSDRVQHQYPQFVAGIAERMFRVDNPNPKPGLRRIVREERKKAGIRWRDLARDAWTGMRGFG
jgi:electron transfer flavoprotein-quinone oxidoreductase